MIHVVEGDLLKSDCTVIGHQCNTFSVMGAGIARQIKRMYPGAYEADKKFPFTPEKRLGKVSYWTNGDVFVFNLYGQYHYGAGKQQTDYAALQQALAGMLYHITQIERWNPSFTIKIGFPYLIGCGLAGGDWKVVEKMIDDVFTNRDVYLYRLEK